MQSDSHPSERRKHPRHEVRDLAIAVPRKSVPHVARIVNISEGGMAVRYLDQTDWLGEAESIDILINSDFFLTRIPIRGISDFEVKNRVSFSIINERQCCLQFGALTSEQQLLLDEFITKHTSGNS